MSKFYITTSIPYINAAPHIGHALEFVQADVLARYHRSLGGEVFFSTGTDDNSLKNVQAAEAAGMSIEKFVAQNSKLFFKLTQSLGISNDGFISTREKRHFQAAQKIWRLCQKDIYKKKYRGLYCVGCEEFKKESELQEGRCPEHPNKDLEKVAEENYFFRLSKYQKQLEQIIKDDKYEIIPKSRKNEALSFIEQGLEDFSISRSWKRARNWGVPVPGDSSQVIYVWFDALVNYISVLDYAGDQKLFKKYWPADIHVIGKGILKFHAVYWPAMLLSAGFKLPRKLFVHGYVTINNQKISKSLGNIIDPSELIKKYGVDALRYFLLREIPPYKDGDFSYQRFKQRYNSDLADDLGNLVQRTAVMIERYLAGQVPKFSIKKAVSDKEFQFAKEEVKVINEAIEKFQFDRALEGIWSIITRANKFIDHKKPYLLFKEDKKATEEVLSELLNYIMDIAILLRPLLPQTSKKIVDIFSKPKIKAPQPLFPRVV